MTTIREIAQQYLQKCRSQGAGHVQARCPVHDDATPSFSLNTENGLWLCFACGATGNLRQLLDIFGITRAEQDIRFRSALEQARQSRKPVQDPTKPKIIAQEPLPEELLGLFRSYPTELTAAGFTWDTLDYFEVGFDKQHLRTTYPIRDLKGNLLGINGRAVIVDDYTPRYKVYTDEYLDWGLPAREEVKKSSVLWNAHNLYSYIHFHASPPFVVVTEGYKACMWVHQAGIKDVVALQTMRMSYEQRWILEHIGAPVHLMLDNNAAGWAGMSQIAKELGKKMTVRIVDYCKEQPDELTKEEVLDCVPRAVDYMKIMAEVS